MTALDGLLDTRCQYGIMTGFQDTGSAKAIVRFAEEHHFDSLWVGDHVAFAVPIMDSLMQLSCLASLTDRLTLGTAVYLLPLRAPAVVAKQVATLDRFSQGKFIFGVGLGGEFPAEYEACGVSVKERGARLAESIPILRKLWTGQKVSYQGQHFQFTDVQMLPKPLQPSGPPIWCGGRQAPALKRAGALADGYISYVVTPDFFSNALATIAAGAEAAHRELAHFGTGHLLFARIGDQYESTFSVAAEHLSQRYAMDFTAATRKYAAVGTPADVAEKINKFQQAGVRHFVLDMVGPNADRPEQLERFAKDVRPLLAA